MIRASLQFLPRHVSRGPGSVVVTRRARRRFPLGGGGLSRRIVVCMILGVASGVVPVSAQVDCSPGVEFYDDGSLKRCNLNGEHRLYAVRGDAVVCANGHPLVLAGDDSLRSCRKS